MKKLLSLIILLCAFHCLATKAASRIAEPEVINITYHSGINQKGKTIRKTGFLKRLTSRFLGNKFSKKLQNPKPGFKISFGLIASLLLLLGLGFLLFASGAIAGWVVFFSWLFSLVFGIIGMKKDAHSSLAKSVVVLTGSIGAFILLFLLLFFISCPHGSCFD
ncbi:MAG: hypothetical protein EPO28_02395 [Saprospiraceae bacterium]|nr:MAG: hypothetical protein EPO28_02395 [Saprospiraceae bacterium]